MIKDWQKRYARGKAMSYAMQGWLPSSETKIIEASEGKSLLAQGLQDALDATMAAKRIRNTILASLAYPFLFLSVLIAMFYGFSIKIVPVFSESVDPALWTGSPRKMYEIGEFLKNYLFYCILGFGALAALCIYAMPRYTGPARVFLEKVPPFSLYKVFTGAAFMMSLRGFLSAGIAVPDALRRIAIGTSPYLQHRTNAIARNLHTGKNLGRAMHMTGHQFPDPEINDEIEVYDGIEGFQENLDMLSKEWIEDTVERTKQATRILTLISLFVMAGGVMFIVSSLFGLQDIIAQSTNR